MATATKTYTENNRSSYKSTWTLSFSASNITASGTSFVVPAPSLTAKYVYSSKNQGEVNVYSRPVINGVAQSADFCHYRGLQSMASGTNYTIPAVVDQWGSVTSVTIQTSSVFSASNSTVRTVTLQYQLTSVWLWSKSSSKENVENSYNWGGTDNIFSSAPTITLNAPPTFTATTTSSGSYYADISTYSVNVSSLSAKYGGTISSVVLNVGGVTASRTTNGTLSVIVPSASGTYTPTVTVKDSRGQVTTTSLTAITVQAHTLPTLSSTVTSSEPYFSLGDTYSVSVSNIQTYEGASVSSVSLVLGSQSDAKTSSFEGTYTINPNTAGTFVPKVVITDTYGATAEYPLPQITVQQYAEPSVSFGIIRTNGNGVKDDEGESAVITAVFSWTSDVARLTAPTVVATDLNGNVQVSSTTWYTSWTSGGGVSGAISDWSSVTSMPVYGLVKNSTDNLFNRLESYYVSVTPHDSIPRDGSTITQTLGSAFYTIDFLAGGHGIAFGEPIAESELFESVGGTSAPTFVTNTYYETVTSGGITNYELLVNEPSDWSTNWTDYYVKVHDGLFKCNMDAYFADKADVMRALFDFIHPVGSYYETSDTSFNPNITWGGTWVLETEGLVHISAGTNYPVSGAPTDTKDGGNKDAIVPYHNHSVNSASAGSHNHGIAQRSGSGTTNTGWHYELEVNNSNGPVYNTNSTTNRASSGIQYAGVTMPAHNTNYAGTSGNATNANMQPYIIVNRWHRTA